jgi:glucose-1-phosphate cytidylyltransferase
VKVVILAGGLGTRISEESLFRPKPMIEIGGMPILWHIMKSYSAQGFNEFIICAGYKQYSIKDFFANRLLNDSDVTFDFTNSAETKTMNTTYHKSRTEPWKVTIVDTGENTNTGGRLDKVKEYLKDNNGDYERFMLTYGDGVSNVDFNQLLNFHKLQVKEGNLVTLTAANIGQQFGVLDIQEDEIKTSVKTFREKSNQDGGWVNSGFMVFEPEIFNKHLNANEMLEPGTLSLLAEKGLLSAYKHQGFWKSMDSMRDKTILEQYWASGDAPWTKFWK